MQKTIRSDMIRSNVILILLVTVCLSGLHLYQIYRYTILQNQEEIIKMSEQARNSLNNMLNQLDVLQYQIVDSLTQSEEYDRIRPVWTKEGIDFFKNTENQFQTFRRAVPFVTNIYWLDNYDRLYTTDSNVSREHFYGNSRISLLEESGGDDCYVPPSVPEYQLVPDSDEVFSYLKNVYRLRQGKERRGVLQIDMRASYMEEILKMINLDRYCLAYVTAGDETIFWFPDRSFIGEKTDRIVYKNFGFGDMDSGYHLVYPLNNGWNLQVRYSNAFALKSLKDNLTSSIILLLIIMPVSVWSVYKYAGYLTGPLQKLTGRMKRLESGELVEIHTISQFEEIRILEQGYNSMISKMDDMMTKMTEIRTENINAKLLALQAQINPHFLANSFELIRGLAIREHNGDIESIAEALGMMYRYILSDGKEKVTLEEELTYVKNYIRIQEYRFQRSIQVLYNIDPRSRECRMARLLIQPLVENAFIHGLELKNGLKWIMITCSVNGETLYVEVKDNGLGIEAERLKELSGDIMDFATKEIGTEKSGRGSGKSIGLKNVNKRLFLSYGASGCLQIISEPGKGTSVSFRIEIEKEEGDGGF
ncbi:MULTISPECIES: sensor histidine kinase [Hungatella]|uniref:histidine kinase n=1 Tax=Hungatella hathewayi TaxID=154046 RepID=A0AAW9WI62_9FIRM|nr:MULTISPECIES: histidine kinase [Hungatella]MCQ4828276.1 histidine kinase [Hungatella sp. SL.1.14]MUB63077.1 HAMP domain-containing protein [Hungatella hathewayi]CUP37865.1 integral membrane sensor signal transduction histidine kinase [Hungatella hathewayi]